MEAFRDPADWRQGEWARDGQWQLIHKEDEDTVLRTPYSYCTRVTIPLVITISCYYCFYSSSYAVLLTVGPSIHTTTHLFTHLYISVIGYSLADSCLLFDYYYYCNCRAIIPVILVMILLCYY